MTVQTDRRVRLDSSRLVVRAQADRPFVHRRPSTCPHSQSRRHLLPNGSDLLRPTCLRSRIQRPSRPRHPQASTSRSLSSTLAITFSSVRRLDLGTPIRERIADLDVCDLTDKLMKAQVTVNRAPVMTAWATVVCLRLNFSLEEALSLGQSVYSVRCTCSGRLTSRSFPSSIASVYTDVCPSLPLSDRRRRS